MYSNWIDSSKNSYSLVRKLNSESWHSIKPKKSEVLEDQGRGVILSWDRPKSLVLEVYAVADDDDDEWCLPT